MSKGRTRALLVTALMLTAGIATTAHAVDGVLEINETCATLSGCFSGDAAGYPITIDGSAGRSYRLTSDLIVPDENTDGIYINTPGVSIDLNGFAIVRSGCEATFGDCTPASGTGVGVNVGGPSRAGLTIRNGSITGMGDTGVVAGNTSTVTALRVRWCRSLGIVAYDGSIIRGNTVEGSDIAIAAIGPSQAVGNVVTGFNLQGLNTGIGSGYGNNLAYSPTGTTIFGSGVDMGGNVCNGSATCP